MSLYESVTYVYRLYRVPFLWFISLGKQRNEHNRIMRFDLQERVTVHVQSREYLDSRFRGNDI
jgi:hypothetical protein